MSTIQVDIHPSLEAEAIRRVERAIAKAEKLGRPEWKPTIAIERVLGYASGNGGNLLLRITVDCPDVALSDWTAVAIADLLNYGTDGHAVVRPLGGRKVPTDAWSVSDRCDHCTWRRKRKSVVVLEHATTGEVVRVGSSCLVEFLGTDAALGLIDAIEALVTWGEHAAVESRSYAYHEGAYQVIDYLAHAIEWSRAFGYRRDAEWTPEGDIAETYALAKRSLYSETAKPSVDAQHAAMVLADWTMTHAHLSDYHRNLASAVGQSVLTSSELSQHARLLASAIAACAEWHRDRQAYVRRMEAWQAKREAPKAIAAANTDSARYKRLRSGAFGVYVYGDRPDCGQRIGVQTAAGAVREETISRVLWSNAEGGEHLCATVRGDAAIESEAA